MERLLLATRNRGKLRELARLFDDLPAAPALLCVDDLDEPPDDVVEDGETFEENALKKAREVARATGLPTLADDSGLEVDALDGAPGVHSARYAGEHGDDEANNARLLRELRGVPDAERTARFRCVLAFVDGDHEHLCSGACEGRVGHAPRGDGGFGYDPLFVIEDGRTMAELSPADKDERSHRARAARAMIAHLARR